MPYRQSFNGHTFRVSGHRQLALKCLKLKGHRIRQRQSQQTGQGQRYQTKTGQRQDRGQDRIGRGLVCWVGS
jgi:hypothetical protein